MVARRQEGSMRSVLPTFVGKWFVGFEKMMWISFMYGQWVMLKVRKIRQVWGRTLWHQMTNSVWIWPLHSGESWQHCLTRGLLNTGRHLCTFEERGVLSDEYSEEDDEDWWEWYDDSGGNFCYWIFYPWGMHDDAVSIIMKTLLMMTELVVFAAWFKKWQHLLTQDF